MWCKLGDVKSCKWDTSIDAKWGTFIDFEVENNNQGPKFKVCDNVRISNHNNFYKMLQFKLVWRRFCGYKS